MPASFFFSHLRENCIQAPTNKKSLINFGKRKQGIEVGVNTLLDVRLEVFSYDGFADPLYITDYAKLLQKFDTTK